MMYFETDYACRGKDLDKMLQPAILMILYNRKLHGFALIQELGGSPMFNGTEPDKAGVYRCLKKMEGCELLKSGWELDAGGNKPKRVYEITDKGRQCLLSWSQALKLYMASMEKLVEQIDGCLYMKER